MTRPARVLRDVVNRYYQSANPVLLRHLETSRQPRIASWEFWPQLPPLSNFSTPQIQRIRESDISRSKSKVPIHSGARPFSHFGKPSPPRRYSKQGSYISKSTNSLTTPKQSSAGSWIAIIAVAITSGAVLYSKRLSANNEYLQEKPPESQGQRDFRPTNLDNMTGEALPGRPGLLTPHEEEKLKEFWTATLQVFGAYDTKELNGHDHEEEPGDKGDGKLSDKMPKKKKLSLFRRKNKGGDTASTTSTESSAPTALGEDDKYGQTKEFHEALASLSPETLRATFWSMVKHDHPDGLLLRFLRARKWDVEKALVMMVSTMRWRSSDVHVDDDIMWNGEMAALDDAHGSDPSKKKHGEDFLTQMRMGKSFLHGTDKEGRPMCFVRVRLHRQGEQSEESLERYTVFVIESARMMLSPPIDTAVSL